MKKHTLVILSLVGLLGTMAPAVNAEAAWKSNSTGKWYTTNSQLGYATGWKKIEKKQYYFEPSSGYAVTGWKLISKKWYFFNAKGQMLTNRWVDGSYLTQDGSMAVSTTINGIEVDHNGSIVSSEGSSSSTVPNKKQSCWSEENGKVYYYDYRGKLAKGLLTIKNAVYYLDPATGARRTGVVTINNKRYFFSPTTGKRTSGWINYKNKRLYASKKTFQLANGWVKIKKKWYSFTKNGVMRKNKWISKKYYVDNDGVMVTGWLTLAGKKYYMDKNGVKSTGWLQLGKKWYYFDPSTGIMATNRWIGSYYVKSGGAMATKEWIGANYVDKSGHKTYKTRSTGFFVSGGKTFYLDKNYKKMTGWIKDGNNYYYFNSKKVMVKSSWIDNEYYVDKNGIRQVNKMLKLGNAYYYFGADGKKTSGLITYNDSKYFFGANYTRQTGLIAIGGKNYYFDPSTGKLVTDDFVEVNGVYYDCDSNGVTTKTSLKNSKYNKGKLIAAYAKKFIGNPYRPGGTSLTNGADCSGFTQAVLKHFGIKIPRVAADQATSSSSYREPNLSKITIIKESQLRPGDLVFYYSPISHVGIYIGNNQIVHASNPAPYPRGGIKISPYNYTKITACARYW